MNAKISKSNDDLAYFNGRLDQVRMTDYERLRAKARLAQSMAIADAAFQMIGFGKRLLKLLVTRPIRRPSTFAG